ncbi:hypothetical protein D9M68_723860 [compost metagenome]
MGGIGDKLRLALEQATQPVVELVQRIHQRAQFARQLDIRQRTQVVAGAFGHRAPQTFQWTQRGTDCQPHQHQRAERQQPHAPEGAIQQIAGHALTRAQGLGHANLGNAIELRFADRLQQTDHTHALAAVFGIVKMRQRRIIVGAPGTARRRRQILVPGNQHAIQIQHLVIDTPCTVVGEGVQGDVGHVGVQLALFGIQTIGNRPRRGQQRAVVSRVGGAPGAPVGAQAAEQQDQRQQHGQAA